VKLNKFAVQCLTISSQLDIVMYLLPENCHFEETVSRGRKEKSVSRIQEPEFRMGYRRKKDTKQGTGHEANNRKQEIKVKASDEAREGALYDPTTQRR
jgi:hypothetical protein